LIICLASVGCRLNYSEIQAMADTLARAGHEIGGARPGSG